MFHFPQVAIVILNWNGKHHLQQFLPSVLSTEYSNYKLIIADNASTDDSVDFLRTEYSQVQIIQLPKNFGFAKGYNEALKEVTADYFVLLNSDVETTPSWLTPIIHLMENDISCGACQPKILSFNNKHFFEYAGAAGGWMDEYGYPFARGRVFDVCEEDRGQYNEPAEVFWASGAAFVIKSDVFRKMNGFDEYFFAHQEEIDLCWRMQLCGYKIFCCPQSVIYHVGGGTLPKGNARKTFLNFRNNEIMLAKNLPLSEKWWKIPCRMMFDNISALRGLFSGDVGYFISIVKAHLAFLYWLFFVKKKNKMPPKKSSRLKGLYRGNIAWQHFAKKKNFFSEIVLPE